MSPMSFTALKLKKSLCKWSKCQNKPNFRTCHKQIVNYNNKTSMILMTLSLKQLQMLVPRWIQSFKRSIFEISSKLFDNIHYDSIFIFYNYFLHQDASKNHNHFFIPMKDIFSFQNSRKHWQKLIGFTLIDCTSKDSFYWGKKINYFQEFVSLSETSSLIIQAVNLLFRLHSIKSSAFLNPKRICENKNFQNCLTFQNEVHLDYGVLSLSYSLKNFQCYPKSHRNDNFLKKINLFKLKTKFLLQFINKSQKLRNNKNRIAQSLCSLQKRTSQQKNKIIDLSTHIFQQIQSGIEFGALLLEHNDQLQLRKMNTQFIFFNHTFFYNGRTKRKSPKNLIYLEKLHLKLKYRMSFKLFLIKIFSFFSFKFVSYNFLNLKQKEKTMSKNPKKIDQLVQAPQIQNYQSKPVQSFGLDLLKRMGFTQERGIGFNKQNALNQPLILKPRPKGLGLGAKPSDAVDQKPQFSKKDCIIVKTGPHEGMIGIIKKIKKQQDVLTIQLGLSGTQIKLKFSQVQKITSSEYQEKKEKLVKQNKQRNEDNQKKKKRLKWVLPHILCKIIDKLSPYYLKKLIINEILNERQFESILISQTGQKKYLKDITQKQLQTVLPKAGGIVLILDKKYRGQKAKVLQRNKEKGQVIVQVLETLQIEKFNEDDLSEFVQI